MNNLSLNYPEDQFIIFLHLLGTFWIFHLWSIYYLLINQNYIYPSNFNRTNALLDIGSSNIFFWVRCGSFKSYTYVSRQQWVLRQRHASCERRILSLGVDLTLFIWWSQDDIEDHLISKYYLIFNITNNLEWCRKFFFF